MRSFIVILCLSALTRAVPFPQNPQHTLQNQPPSDLQHQQIQSSQQKQQVLQTPKQNVEISQDQSFAASNHLMDKDVASTNILENPAYNPDIYSSFIPQDAIQQYINYFGGHQIPYTASVIPPPTPLAVQTGYEGYIVPVRPVQSEPVPYGSWSSLRGLIPKFFLAWIIKFAAIVLSAVGVVLFGGAVTTAICSFTPLCTISFSALPNLAKSLSYEVTPERVRRTAELVQTAIEKYSELQRYNEMDSSSSSVIQKIEKKH